MKKLTLLLTTLLLSQTGFAAESRLSLTASDGTGLELHQFKARVVLEGFLAFTELEMVFYNPENRQREGRFQIILPDNAAISRFAMKIGDRLQEGEIVEKQLARRAYEDFLHRRQDPALLETDSGNRFNARIFPIAPKSEKLLILSYSQRLDGLQNDYVLPLKGLPKLKQLSVKVFYDRDHFSTAELGELTGTVSKREILSIEKSDYQPAVDFRMPYQAVKGDLVMQSEQLVAARIVPFTASALTDEASQGFDNLVLLIDTSASQAPYLADSLKRLETLLPQLQVATLQIYTFDQTVRKFISPKGNPAAAAPTNNGIDTFNQMERKFISPTETPAAPTNNQSIFDKDHFPSALGASRVDAAIEALKAVKLEKSRLLLISDTVVTAGETSATALAEQLKTVPWLERVDILVPSYHSDKQIARRLAKAGQFPGIVAPLTLSDEHLIRKLTHSVYADQPINVSGSTWYWPEQVDALQIDEPLIVFAELSPEFSAKSVMTISVGDRQWTLTSQPANPILLKREWVRARLDKLLDREDKTSDPDLKNAFHNEVTNLSVKQRVLSPYTSLLVLETEDDYRRYNIDRNGLADIMTIGVDGLTVIKRAGVEETEPPVPEEIALPDETVLQNQDVDALFKSFIDCLVQEHKEIDTCIPGNKDQFIALLRDDLEKENFTEENTEKAEEFFTLIVQGNTEGLLSWMHDQEAYAADAHPSEASAPQSENDDEPVALGVMPESAALDTDTEAADLEITSGDTSSEVAAIEPSDSAGEETEYMPMLTYQHTPPPPVEEEDSEQRREGSGDEADTSRPIRRMMGFSAFGRSRVADDAADSDSEQTYSAGRQESVQLEVEGAAVPRDETDHPRLSMSPPMAEEPQSANDMPEPNAVIAPAQASEEERQPAAAAPAERRQGVGFSAMTTLQRAEVQEEIVVQEIVVPQISPWTGRYGEFRALLDKADLTAAGQFAQQWHQENLADVMAIVALGEWYEKTGETAQAARAYGSLIDYFPARADIRRWTAERLLSLQSERWLSIDSLNKAVEQRPDHPSGHYLLAIAYWEDGQSKKAVETLQAAIKRNYPRFDAATRILTETLALMLTQLEQQQQLEALFPGKALNWEKMTQRQLRLVLMWETDANDVDFHIYDNQQHHAFYRQKSLATGGTLYADITTGYGPECFSISEPNAFPYRAQAHYYRMGPMGYGMGVLHVLQYDPKTGLNSEFRPFLVMKDGAFVELGTVKSPW